jgi:predicted Zn-dependent peptidase
MKLNTIRTVILCLLPIGLSAQNLQEFEKKVTEFTLANGMHFIVIERHQAPVVSFDTYVDAGAVDDPSGETGIAHMFEHMAFKGTEAIGTKDYPAEKAALDHMERVYDRLDQLKREALKRHQPPDNKEIEAAKAELKAAMDKANSYVIPNEFDRIVEINGGVGMNAATAEDSTNYYYNFPSNRLELWFLLESQRFLAPVFREFYKERDVVREERRMRTESSPVGKLVEALTAAAFEAHPYKTSAVGWGSDIDNFRLEEAVQFYKKYYVPADITMGIAGDVDPREARRLAEKYFGAIPAGPLPPRVRTVEPPQTGERRAVVESPAQPLLIIAYKRPDENNPDDPVLDVISEILSGGRTGTLYTDMVRDKKIALGASTYPAYPGAKYPSLFLCFVAPNLGHSVEENEKEALAVMDRLKTQKVDQETLNRVKTKLRAGVIRSLDSNAGLASTLPAYYVAFGDWRRLFTQLDTYNKITADDVERVARKYFVASGRTVAWTVQPNTPPVASLAAQAAGQQPPAGGAHE